MMAPESVVELPEIRRIVVFFIVTGTLLRDEELCRQVNFGQQSGETKILRGISAFRLNQIVQNMQHLEKENWSHSARTTPQAQNAIECERKVRNNQVL
jgi:hypothetical protein